MGNGSGYGQIVVENTGTGHNLALLGVDNGSFSDIGDLVLYSGGNAAIELQPESGLGIRGLNSGNPIYYLGYYGGGDMSEGALDFKKLGTITTTITGNHGSIFNGGNVGIGSATANNTLEVNGGVRVENLGASSNICTDGSRNLTTSGCAAGSSQWTTTNTNDVYLPSSGNVGIRN